MPNTTDMHIPSIVYVEDIDQKPDGRSHRFTPLITKDAFQFEMVRQMRTDLFCGDVGRMLKCMADDDGIETVMRSRIQALAGEGRPAC